VAVALNTYPDGGLVMLMPAAFFAWLAMPRLLPRWAVMSARVVVIAATLVWPITWIGVGLVLAPIVVPLFVWAILPRPITTSTGGNRSR
jgi:hypothetical protein